MDGSIKTACRPVWGKLHSRNNFEPLPPNPPPPPARRKQGQRTQFELGRLLSNLFPKKILRPARGEDRSSKIQVKPYLGKPLPRPLGRPPARQRSGKLIERLPKGALAQAISLGVVAAVLAVWGRSNCCLAPNWYLLPGTCLYEGCEEELVPTA